MKGDGHDPSFLLLYDKHAADSMALYRFIEVDIMRDDHTRGVLNHSAETHSREDIHL